MTEIDADGRVRGFREDTERDLILTAERALDYGVIDAIMTTRGER
mgnify:CR=1 FL=1